MRMLFFVTLFVFFSTDIFSQGKNNSEYRIQNIPIGKTAEYYFDAIDAADFSCYRFKTKSRILKFKDGAELELFSESQLVGSGIKTGNCALSDDAKVQDCVLKISSDGHLLLEFVAPPSKSTLK